MIIASHVVFTTYGFWLPNDPRGSWSDYVGAWELYRAGGKATLIHARRSVAGRAHDTRKRLETKEQLKYPAVEFSGLQARAVGRGFHETVLRYGYSIYACSILPDHVHLVLGRAEIDVRQVVRQLKQFATQRLKSEGLYPESNPTPWAKSCWTVYLNDDEAVRRAVRYVENNPRKEGKPDQTWKFVKPYHF